MTVAQRKVASSRQAKNIRSRGRPLFARGQIGSDGDPA
jgi:hypothetical protein